MKKILIIIICLISINVKATTFTKDAIFVRCVDGDTAVFNVSDEEVKFRFLAIDTPETVHPTKDVEAFGKDASEYTCNKLTNAQNIVLEYESSNTKDKYGRSLAWIWVDGSLLQKELIEVGYAKVAYIYGNYRYTTSLCLYQDKAITKNLGTWEDNNDIGYCETVDLTDVQDNINFANIANEDTISSEEQNTLNTLDNINNIEEKISNYLDDNDEKINKYLVYGFIIIAIIYMVMKEVKK